MGSILWEKKDTQHSFFYHFYILEGVCLVAMNMSLYC